MYSVLESLYISSFDVASQEDQLSKNSIRHIVSIGCDTSDQFPSLQYLSFPYILDTPETNIISITGQTSAFIKTALDSGDRVLVHCVYGQSRSATVIIAYLLSTGVSLPDAISLMKSNNPNTSVNPGFLAQLCFLAVAGTTSVEQRYFQHGCIVDIRQNMKSTETVDRVGVKRRSPELSHSADFSGSDAAESTVICRGCKSNVALLSETLGESISTVAFVKKHEDGFWRGYRPSRPKALGPPVTLPDRSLVAVYPSEWMVAQVHSHREQCGLGDKYVRVERTTADGKEKPVNGDECELLCTSCATPIGFWRSKSLNLLGEYNLCDLFAFKTECVRVKKVRNIPAL